MAPDFDRALALIDAAHAQDPNLITITSSTSTSPSSPSSSSSPTTSSPPPPSSYDPSPPAQTIPYELHYARKMTSYLHLHVQGSNPTDTTTTTIPSPSPSPHLSLAVRAQHLRRWEIPRASYPPGKAGYFAWRTALKKRQAEQARDICLQCGYGDEDADRVAALVGKVGFKKKAPPPPPPTTTTKSDTEEKDETKVDREEDGEDEVQVLEDVACLVFLDDQFEAFERAHDEDKMLGILAKTWAKMGPRGRELALRIRMSERCRQLVERALAG